MQWLVLFAVTVCAELEVTLKAPWPAPTPSSLLQELSEFLWTADSASFWTFLAHLSTQSPAPTLSSALSSLSLSPAETRLVELSLHTREFAPRLQVHSSLYQRHKGSLTCKEFFYFPEANNSFCDFPLPPVHSQAPKSTYDFDHIWTGRMDVTVIHYRDISNPLSYAALSKAQSLDWTYVLRHIDLRNHQANDTLAGFGAQLLIKNMEYKPVEDPSRPAVISGFDFSVLKSRFPEAREKLEELQSYLDRRYDWNRPLKNWEMKGN